MTVVAYKRSKEGLVVCGNALTSVPVTNLVDGFATKFKLIICDPPYGKIVAEDWDKSADYDTWMHHCIEAANEAATICMWGGVGTYQHRPFLQFAANVERTYPEWTLKNWITWGKRRAYGVKDNYLFTREECLILTRGKPTFNIPLLDKLRGYAGYSEKYPAKSEFLRRTNVWSDITELFKGKIHPCQKPDPLYEVLINTHSNVGDCVYDPCAGSLTTMRVALKTKRRFVVVEQHAKYIERAGVKL